MLSPTLSLQSIPGVCDLEIVADSRRRTGADTSTGSPARPGLLIEVPHGATRRRHFEATRKRLVGEFPDDLEEFFYVNTDVGSIECARWIARMVVNPSEHPELRTTRDPKAGEPRSPVDSVLIVRGLLARTFVDLNRRVTPAARAGLTAALPDYVTHPQDIATLSSLHAEYQAVAERAYELVCGPGRSAGALILHTYAPRVVEIDRIDRGIVAALRSAYEPEVFSTLARRPDVDLITETLDGNRLAPEALARLVRDKYASIGIEATENESYRLHEASMGYVHSASYPGRVLSVEISRALLADPFTPFAEMSISDSKARRMAAPIAAAFLGMQSVDVRGR